MLNRLTMPPSGQKEAGCGCLSLPSVQGSRFIRLLIVPKWLTTAILRSLRRLSQSLNCARRSGSAQWDCHFGPCAKPPASHASSQSAVAFSDRACSTAGHCVRTGSCRSSARVLPRFSRLSSNHTRIRARVRMMFTPPRTRGARVLSLISPHRCAADPQT